MHHIMSYFHLNYNISFTIMQDPKEKDIIPCNKADSGR